jgi:hypothetical protein
MWLLRMLPRRNAQQSLFFRAGGVSVSIAAGVRHCLILQAGSTYRVVPRFLNGGREATGWNGSTLDLDALGNRYPGIARGLSSFWRSAPSENRDAVFWHRFAMRELRGRLVTGVAAALDAPTNV